MADDELEHVLFEDSDEVSNTPQKVMQDQPGLMYARHTVRRLFTLKLRVNALTGRTLNLQKAVLSLLHLPRMCQKTTFIANYTTLLLVQHQNHRQIARKRPCNSLLRPRLLAKVTELPARHAPCVKCIATDLRCYSQLCSSWIQQRYWPSNRKPLPTGLLLFQTKPQ